MLHPFGLKKGQVSNQQHWLRLMLPRAPPKKKRKRKKRLILPV